MDLPLFAYNYKRKDSSNNNDPDLQTLNCIMLLFFNEPENIIIDLDLVPFVKDIVTHTGIKPAPDVRIAENIQKTHRFNKLSF